MKILMINGNPEAEDRSFERFMDDLKNQLSQSDVHQVEYFTLRQMNIKPCKGCFGCWVKTPGECTRKDDGNLISQAYINSDLVIHASPIIMGFISSLTKKVMDRTIPILLPYFNLFNGEIHHLPRYDLKRYPDFAFLVQKEEDTDNEDMKIMENIFNRNVKNLNGKLQFIKTINDISIREVLDEINRI